MPKHPPTQPANADLTQPKHKFGIGQIVRVVAGSTMDRSAAQGTYKIVGQLPGDGSEFSYRVKSTSEPHERVVRESQLTR
jgi:hypothetical protein